MNVVKGTNGMYYEPENDFWEYIKNALEFIVVFIMIFTMLFCLCSCATKKVVKEKDVVDSVSVVKADSTNNSAYHIEYRDSNKDHYVNNTVVLSESGDTVRVNIVERLYDTKKVYVHDTISVFKMKTDTLNHVLKQNVYIEKEKELGWFDRFRIASFWYLIVFIVLTLCIVELWNKKK